MAQRLEVWQCTRCEATRTFGFGYIDPWAKEKPRTHIEGARLTCTGLCNKLTLHKFTGKYVEKEYSHHRMEN